VIDWVAVVLASLAVWRISHMVVKEDGPFEVFRKIRDRAGVQWDEDNGQLYGVDFKSALLSCPLCLSVWIAAPIAIWLHPVLPDVFVVWFGLSGASCILELGVGDGR
jgi:hypothetical protein